MMGTCGRAKLLTPLFQDEKEKWERLRPPRSPLGIPSMKTHYAHLLRVLLPPAIATGYGQAFNTSAFGRHP